MKRLTSKEKYFISCFVEKCNHLLQPSLDTTISLYTFLDGTNESYERQIRQMELHDPLLAQILFDISNMVDDEKFYKKKLKELQKLGYSDSLYFLNAIRRVSEWLWLIESDDVRRRVRNYFSKKFEKNKRVKEIKRQECYESIRRENQSASGKKIIAEKLVYATNVLSKQKPKNAAIPPGINRPTGTIVCFACNGFGSITLGRSCSKCMGRGFLRN